MCFFVDFELSLIFWVMFRNFVEFVNNVGRMLLQDFECVFDFYDVGIWYIDSLFQSLLEDFCGCGFFDNVLLVVMLDYGEEFGEYGGFLYCGLFYDELFRVLLIVVGLDILVVCL